MIHLVFRRIRPLLLTLFFCWAALPLAAAHPTDTVLISYQLAERYERAVLDSLWKANKVPQFISPVRYGVRVYEVQYWTRWHDGTPIRASGLYYLPEEIHEDLPVVSFSHGSESTRREGIKVGGVAVITLALAADGYAACLPDYVGLGTGDKFHLYHHSATEAGANVDMLRAARALNAKEGYSWGEYLFLSGYSQGGHAAAATHKAIEEKYADEFSLTASAPMSGAYDLAGVQGEAMFRPYETPGYFPFMLYGMNEAYDLFPNWRMALKPAYRDTLAALVESQAYTLREISQAMPDTPVAIVMPEIVASFRSGEPTDFRDAMEENSLIDWAPQRPMMLCYCEADEQVDYRNSIVAYERMRALGSESVRLHRAGKKFGHNECALYASIYTKLYFDSFLKGSKKGRKGPLRKRWLIALGKIGGGS